MRRLALLLLLSPLVVSCRQIQPFHAPRSAAFIADPLRPRQAKTSLAPISQSPLTQLRAGSIVPLPSTTATAAGVFLGANGIMLLTKPRALLKNVYGLTIDHDDDELIAWELRGIGSLGLGLAIQVYASIVQGIAPITAMGLGLIPRALFYLYTTFSGKMKSLNIQTRFFTMNTVMTCWCVASLLLGLGKPSTTSKIYSSMCFLKSLFFTWAPRTSCKKLLGRPCEGQALGLMRGAGNELFVSSLLMLSAAWASNIVSPVAAAGYVCVAWVVLLADMAMLAKTWQLMGFSNARTNWVNLIMAAVLGTGFLLAK